MQITQPASVPNSPLSSPSIVQTTSASPVNFTVVPNTTDPNWQASKSTVRERNAAMFNNELMADVKFLVGSSGNLVTEKIDKPTNSMVATIAPRGYEFE